MTVGKLTNKQRRFADEYLVDLNGTRAYKIAYPAIKSEAAAAVNASRLLKNAKVAEYVSKKQQKLSDNLMVSAERVLKEYARLSFYNPKEFFDKDGEPMSIHDLSDDAAAAIQGIDIQIQTDSRTGAEVSRIRKVKLAGKAQPLEALAKHLGLFDKDGRNKEGAVPIKVEIVREDASKSK